MHVQGLLCFETCFESTLFCARLPQRQDDHGTMVFQCQPWLTMVGRVATMVSDHGPRKALTMVHGQPWSEIKITMVKLVPFDVHG